MIRAVDGDDVGAVVWRDLQRWHQDMLAAEKALECDAYRPEMLNAARALEKLANTSVRMAANLREARPLPEPESVQ